MKNFLIKLALFVSILLSGINSANAVIQGWVPPEDYGEGDSIEIGMESSEEIEGIEIESEEMSMEDIFGSEQVFPFPPGLGN
tara:strand:- start:5983 stop:6228 length:246 start_codon:yes stop_codon:yes gene_type:complete